MKRYPFVWTCLGVAAGCVALSAVSGTNGGLVPNMALALLGIVGLGIAVPISRFPGYEPLPLRVMLVSAGVLVAGCGWLLTLPVQDLDTWEVPIVGLLKVDISDRTAEMFVDISWLSFLAAILFAILNWFLCSFGRRHAGS